MTNRGLCPLFVFAAGSTGSASLVSFADSTDQGLLTASVRG